MDDKEKWYGIAYEEIDKSKDEIPQNTRKVETLKPDVDRCSAIIYAKVHFSGNYGFLGTLFQSFDRYNIDKREAHEIAWSAFGICNHSIKYFDSKGNLVDQE